MDDLFPMTSFMECIRSAGLFIEPAGVSGILQPAWIRTVFGSVLKKKKKKNESGDCLPAVACPHPPNLPADPFFFLKRKSLSPQTSPLPSSLLTVLFEYSSSSKLTKIHGRVNVLFNIKPAGGKVDFSHTPKPSRQFFFVFSCLGLKDHANSMSQKKAVEAMASPFMSAVEHSFVVWQPVV